MLGLKRGTVALAPHEDGWDRMAAETIRLLKELLGSTAVDIQHIGSTAIAGICAKPIIDIAVGVHRLQDVETHMATLAGKGIVFRGQDIADQVLFVMGDFERDVRTHHIHFLRWGSEAWNNYVNFRDYLNRFPERARAYEAQKLALARKFPGNRSEYTEGKKARIEMLLGEARRWRESISH